VSVDPGNDEVRPLPYYALPRDWLCGLTPNTIDQWRLTAKSPTVF
jgi:hypothetical protein